MCMSIPETWRLAIPRLLALLSMTWAPTRNPIAMVMPWGEMAKSPKIGMRSMIGHRSSANTFKGQLLEKGSQSYGQARRRRTRRQARPRVAGDA